MTRLIDLKGKRFGRLIVLERAKKRKGVYWVCWVCKCDCGTVMTVAGKSLRNDETKSCGCLNQEIVTKRNTKHGQSKDGQMSKEARAWSHMKQRCENPNDKSYKHYGERGIRVCARWRESFGAFFDDMGQCPPGMSLDRIDNDGSYGPENCRWATLRQQANNKKGTLYMIYRGEKRSLKQWCRLLNIDYYKTWKLVKKGSQLEEIVTSHAQVARA